MSIAESFGYDLPDINVGVYAFSDKATKISDLTDISDQSNRAHILRKIEGIKFEKEHGRNLLRSRAPSCLLRSSGNKI